jgi:hypothetical protein
VNIGGRPMSYLERSDMDYKLELVLIPGNIWILQEIDRSKAEHGSD